jgi:hypothetical protein
MHPLYLYALFMHYCIFIIITFIVIFITKIRGYIVTETSKAEWKLFHQSKDALCIKWTTLPLYSASRDLPFYSACGGKTKIE